MMCNLCDQESVGRVLTADPLTTGACCSLCFKRRGLPARLAIAKLMTDEEEGTLIVH